jgi:hypothetical protein
MNIGKMYEIRNIASLVSTKGSKTGKKKRKKKRVKLYREVSESIKKNG